MMVGCISHQHFLFCQKPGLELVTVTFNETTLDQALLYFEKEHKVHFFFKRELQLNNIRVTGNYIEKPLRGVLDSMLHRTGLQLIVFDESIYILTSGDIVQGQEFSNYFLVKEKLSREFKPNALILGSPDSMSRSGNAWIIGHVRNGSDETPVPHAVVKIDTFVTMTDSFGSFRLEIPVGWHTLLVESSDYINIQQTLKVYGNSTIQLSLYQNSIDLPELVIGAAAGRRIESAQAGVAELTIKEIKRLPALFGEADVLKTLLTLPGVSNTGEVGGGYNVRGGNIDQNLIQQDGVAYLNPSHVLGLFSAFNADAIQSVTLYKGHIPAQFGGRASSVLDIKLKDPDLERWSFHGGIGPVSSKFFAEGPLIKDKTSILIGNRMSYSSWILNLVRDPNLKNSRANFYDLNIKVFHRFHTRSTLSVTAYSSKDDFKYSTDFGYGWQTQSAVINWMYQIKPKLIFQSSLMWNDNKNRFTDDDDIIENRIENGLTYYKSRLNLSWQPSVNHSFQAGLEGIVYRPRQETFDAIPENAPAIKELYKKSKGQEAAVYLQDEIRLTRMFNLSLGYRHSFFRHTGAETINIYDDTQSRTLEHITGTRNFNAGQTIKTYHGPEPRASLAYKLSESSSIKWSYNRLYQYIHLISNTAAATPVDIWQLSTFHLAPQKANNYSLGYFKNFNNNQWESSVEIYYKKSQRLLEYKDFARLLKNEHLETELFEVNGKSYGAELFFKRTRNNPKGYLSYTLNKSLRRSPGIFVDEIINQGRWYASNFDKPHTLNAVLDWQMKKTLAWSFNFVYNSGRPATAPVADFYLGEGGVFLDYSDRNEHRIPDYHRLDISFTTTRGVIRTRRYKGSLTLSVYNIYSRRNAFSIFYRRNINEPLVAYKLSVLGAALPSITYNFQF